MIALMWTALAVVALVAATALGLVLVLARRFQVVATRVAAFLPDSEGGLPEPGTPVPEFVAATADGATVSHEDLAGSDRILAFLTTDCASCIDQVPALRQLDPQQHRRPIVVVIGEPAQRSTMVASLAEAAIVVEEDADGALARAFDIREFPGVLAVGQGVVRTAGHGLAGVLQRLAEPAPATR